MTPEDRLLFLCCRQDFSESYQRLVLDLCGDRSIHWEALFSKAEQHGVAPLIFINLCQHADLDLNIPHSIVDHYHKVTLRNRITKEQRAQRLVQALSYFQDRAIDVLLIKGVALDLLVYENPVFVTSGDIDIVLHRKLAEFDPDALQHLHHTMHRSGIEYDFFEHHDMTINGTLPVDFSQIWEDARRIDYRGQSVYLMCPEDMLISLCINSCRKRFFRLKSVLDIAETLRVEKDLNWDVMAEKARSYECQNIIYTALQVTRQILGCELPERGLERLGVGKLRSMLIDSATKLLIRYTSLPANPNAVSLNKQRPADLSLVLPYLAYQGYQVRHKLLHDIRSRD